MDRGDYASQCKKKYNVSDSVHLNTSKTVNFSDCVFLFFCKVYIKSRMLVTVYI